ncbi:thioredoxin [Dendrothele bispora CBS 962.96]|uniref:Thioredoxin n=1 Tax=Dendrothele bispora (strain CBS 962.96) TaxID=1314807 RepID=A0A4S8L1L5_DENBC|nr:thioredoxin [Dendrothele bispora CBS 962.96]
MGVEAIKSLDDFHSIINNGKPILIDFWATWCGPCRVISPIFEQFSGMEQFSGVEFYKVDVDKQTDISEEVGIKAMPTFVLYKDGKKLNEVVGAHPQKLEQVAKDAKGLLA